MVDALSEYSFAFAATSQQSVNRDMQKRKGLVRGDVNENQKGMEYNMSSWMETARVSPRDLMVPMAQRQAHHSGGRPSAVAAYH